MESIICRVLKKYYEFLKESTREKDKARIPLVEDYIKK